MLKSLPTLKSRSTHHPRYAGFSTHAQLLTAKPGHSDTSDIDASGYNTTINSNKYKNRCTYIVLITLQAILILFKFLY
jgi:hypothetical protein